MRIGLAHTLLLLLILFLILILLLLGFASWLGDFTREL
jgi:hypothetical protein